MAATVTATDEVVHLIESRLKEIEEQLSPLVELEREQTKLRDALGALRAGASTDTGRTRAHRSGGTSSRGRRSSKRAPRGSNVTAILEHVAAHPGVTAGDIAAATGITRGVVYSAVSRLSADGRLLRQPRDDGQVAYRTPSSGD
jgi:hypothetical protein